MWVSLGNTWASLIVCIVSSTFLKTFSQNIFQVQNLLPNLKIILKMLHKYFQNVFKPIAMHRFESEYTCVHSVHSNQRSDTKLVTSQNYKEFKLLKTIKRQHSTS